jgi:hypothetical protein
VARAQIDAGNPDFWRQSAVRLRQRNGLGCPLTS